MVVTLAGRVGNKGGGSQSRRTRRLDAAVLSPAPGSAQGEKSAS